MVGLLIFFKNTCPSVLRTAYHYPGMAFVVVQGCIYHCLLYFREKERERERERECVCERAAFEATL